jgi:3-oxoacyl-[acyl-carrier-protein] synthase III
VGVGSSAPATVLSNSDLERYIDTNDEWITTRTGIKRRHILGEGESVAQHAANACQKALDMAGVSPDQVDMILLATSTPDDAFGSACQVRRAPARARFACAPAPLAPAAAREGRAARQQVSSCPGRPCRPCTLQRGSNHGLLPRPPCPPPQVQALIGAKNAVAFDLTAACSGFVLALVTAAQYVRTGACKHCLVVGADALSRITDWRDRGGWGAHLARQAPACVQGDACQRSITSG